MKQFEDGRFRLHNQLVAGLEIDVTVRKVGLDATADMRKEENMSIAANLPDLLTDQF